MNTIFKYATAAALTGAIALAAATPSEARNGRNATAIGFGVGAIAGAAIASSAYSNGYYGYYGEPGYAYGYAPGYAAASCCLLESRQPVERALQDKCGSVLIDDGGALLAADVCGNQISLNRDG